MYRLNKIGKINFNLGDFLKSKNANCIKDYNNTLNVGTTIATISAGIVSTNIVTPIIRNHMATKAQKNYLNYKENLKENQPTFKANQYFSYGMKI